MAVPSYSKLTSVPQLYYKQWKFIPKQEPYVNFGQHFYVEIDPDNPAELLIYSYVNNHRSLLTRAQIPSRVSFNDFGLVEINYYFETCCQLILSSEEKDKRVFKLCWHLSNQKRNACFLFEVLDANEYESVDEEYLGIFLIETI